MSESTPYSPLPDSFDNRKPYFPEYAQSTLPLKEFILKYVPLWEMLIAYREAVAAAWPAYVQAHDLNVNPAESFKAMQDALDGRLITADTPEEAVRAYFIALGFCPKPGDNRLHTSTFKLAYAALQELMRLLYPKEMGIASNADEQTANQV